MLYTPPCFTGVLWVCLKASVVFLSTDFCLALEAVCKILEGLLLLFSLSGMSGMMYLYFARKDGLWF